MTHLDCGRVPLQGEAGPSWNWPIRAQNQSFALSLPSPSWQGRVHAGANIAAPSQPATYRVPATATAAQAAAAAASVAPSRVREGLARVAGTGQQPQSPIYDEFYVGGENRTSGGCGYSSFSAAAEPTAGGLRRSRLGGAAALAGAGACPMLSDSVSSQPEARIWGRFSSTCWRYCAGSSALCAGGIVCPSGSQP
jgi:hypothetical protein